MEMNTALHQAIKDHIDDKFSEVIPLKYHAKIINSLSEFIEFSISKFARGCIEHNDSDLVDDCNLDAEIQSEVVDLFWYTQAKEWKKQNDNITRTNN